MEEDLYASEYWKLGLFYFNSQNPKIFVPKRLGIGWTINFAKWQSWSLIGFLICVFVAIRFMLKK
jgi:uncharacterized membrane protein